MDEFDHALMEALNEAVPPADFATDLAGRLVARARRRTRFWKLLFALGLFSAATAAVVTATALSTGTTGVSPVEFLPTGTTDVSSVEFLPTGTTDVSSVEPLPTGTTDVSPVDTGGDSTGPSSTIHYSLFTLNSPQGAPQVQSTTLKKAAALMGAAALAATAPTRADGYQFIVSGYSAANPSQSAVSSGTSLAVGALAATSASADLEARARTCDDSDGTALRSDKYTAMIIIIK